MTTFAMCVRRGEESIEKGELDHSIITRPLAIGPFSLCFRFLLQLKGAAQTVSLLCKSAVYCVIAFF